MRDDLARAAADLLLLPRADRDAVLAALDRDERRRVEAAMRGSIPPAAEPTHSAWFDALIESEDATPAARAALAAARTPGPVAMAERAPGRTLIQAAGGLFAQGGLRR